MDDIKTFSLLRHSRLFSVPDNSQDYLFVQAADHPYLEEPYRAESYAAAFLKEGSIHLQAGLNAYDISAPAIIALGPTVIRSFRKRNELMKMDIVFFKETFLLERYPDLFFLVKYDFFENNELHVLYLKAPDELKFKKIFELIELIKVSADFHQAEVIRNLIFILIYEIDNHHRQYSSGLPAFADTNPLFARFKQLLARNYMNERKREFYARQLHVTPKYLSATIKKQTGKSAGEWIDETITLEAKVLLQNKTLSVSQISNMLNFADQSIFGKFFKSNTGISPLEYRKKL